MPLADYVLDNGLAAIVGANRRLDICHTLPATYGEATTDGAYSVGNKTGLTVGAIAARAPNGRKITVPAVADGAITETSSSTANDAQFWALTDPANSRLLCTGSLASAQFVTDGNTWNTGAFDIGIPNQ